jgi:hypothetical protein
MIKTRTAINQNRDRNIYMTFKLKDSNREKIKDQCGPVMSEYDKNGADKKYSVLGIADIGKSSFSKIPFAKVRWFESTHGGYNFHFLFYVCFLFFSYAGYNYFCYR